MTNLMDAKAKIVRWECRPLNWEVQYQQRDDGEWVKFTDHEAALAENEAHIRKLDGIIEEVGGVTASCINPYEDLKRALVGQKERAIAAENRLQTLLSGLEALAGEWDVVGSDVWANELRERIRTLTNSAKGGSANDPRTDPELVWSTNEEEFKHDSLGEALQSIYDDGDELQPGRTVWYATKSKPKASRFVPDSDWFIDHMATSAYDEGGEWAEDFAMDTPKEALKELETMLATWADTHVPVNFWTVDDVKPYQVTAEDIAEVSK